MRPEPIQNESQDGRAVQRSVVITLLVMIACLLCFWYYHEIIAWFPSHIHAWTQSDRLALAYGYLENGFHFFTPRTYNLYTSDGITGVDFPIHEYIVALLMKLFGTKEPMIFRAYTLAYSLIGYVFLYLLALRITGREVLACVVVLFAFTCPILTYYQIGFIPSATSLASSFAGFYYFFRFKTEKKRALMYWAIGFFTLAALPRASVNIVLFAVLLMEVFEWWRLRRIDKNVLLAFLVAYAVIGASLIYKGYMSAEYGTRFLTSLMPASDATQFLDILKESWSRWHFQLLTKYHWALLGLSLIGSVALLFKGKLRILDKQVLLTSFLLLGGSAFFFVALARQFIAHEYYFIDSLYPAIILIFIPGLHSFIRSTRVGTILWCVILAGLLAGAALDSKSVQNEKYAETEWDRGEVTRKNFTGAGTFLDQLGIPGEARILVFEAYSTNAPLLLMGRRGYTILDSKPENIWRALDLEFDYIVVQDVYMPSELVYNAPSIVYTLQRIGGNGRISVFTYHQERVPGIAYPIQQKVHELLGLNEELFHTKLILSPKSVADTTVGKAERITKEVEFGGALVVPLIELNGANRVLIDVAFDGDRSKDMSDQAYEFDIVLSIESQSDQKQYYKSFRVKRSKSEELFFGYACLFEIPDLIQTDLTLKCYIWNRFGYELDVNSIEFTAYKPRYTEEGN